VETKNTKILITGANRGIGKAVAKRLAEDGAYLLLACRKQDEKLIAELTAAGAASVKILEGDLSTKEGVQSLVDQANKHQVDILFNNAGQLTGGLLEDQAIDDIYNMLQVNVNALIHLTRGVLPGMIERNCGKIINHSSVMGIMQLPTTSTYAASKAAVIAFTNALRQELKPTKVTTLTLITPGVKTRMFDQIAPLHGKNLDIPQSTIPPERYAEMIREAIVEDLEILNPSGFTGAALKLAKYLPVVFEKGASFKFKR